MPIIEPDLSDVTSGAIDAGTYKAKIVSVENTVSKSAGNPMIVPKFEVTVGDKTFTRKAYLVITGQGAFNFEQLLRACHFDEVADQMKAGVKVPFDTDQLINQELNVIIDADSYNGQITDKIRSYVKA